MDIGRQIRVITIEAPEPAPDTAPQPAAQPEPVPAAPGPGGSART